MLKGILYIAAMLILISNVLALDAKTYAVTFNIVEDKAVVDVSIILNETSSEVFTFQLPDDYKGLSVYVDGESINPDVERNILNINLDQNSTIKISYITEELVDKNNFLAHIGIDHNIDKFGMKLVLPEGAVLKEPISSGDINSGSIYPKPTRSTTDGKSMIFYWLKNNMDEGDEMSIFVQTDKEMDKLALLLVVFIGILVLIIVITGLVYWKKRKTSVKNHEVKDDLETEPVNKENVEITIENVKKNDDVYDDVYIEKKADSTYSHLKKDEEQIINILRLKEGSCEQATLRIITGFSKATLSRILMELEARDFIVKEKKGKKNLISLKE